MKKLTMLLLGATLVAGTALSAVAANPITFPISVIVVANNIEITGNSTDANAMAFFGSVLAGSTAFSNSGGNDSNAPVVSIVNVGASNIDLTVAQAGSTTNNANNPLSVWTPVTAGTAGDVMTVDNNYRLSGVFTTYFANAASALAAKAAGVDGSGNPNPVVDNVNYRTLVKGDFDATDVIKTGLGVTASNTTFGVDSQPFTLNLKGHNVPFAAPGQEYLGTRNMRFALDAPLSTSRGLSIAQKFNVTIQAAPAVAP